jgi:flagellar export protein FliJ
MPRKSLQALLRLRQLTVAEARRSLAECLDCQEQAERAAHAIEAEIRRETEAACRLGGGDEAVEAFAAWLQRVRPAAQAADAELEAAALRTSEARAVLSAARAAAEATEALLARDTAERDAAAARTEQRALDEAAGRARLPGGRRGSGCV